MHAMNRKEKSRMIEDWMAEYGTGLLRMNFLYLKDAQLAEDVTQETFLKAFRQMEQFRGESSVKTWLVRISINLCKDERKKAWHRQVALAGEGMDELERGLSVGAGVAGCSAESRSADEQVLEKQRNRELLKAVTQLPEKGREVVLLYYYQEFSLREIAEILGIPEDTASTRLRRARLQLKEKLKGWWDDENEIG